MDANIWRDSRIAIASTNDGEVIAMIHVMMAETDGIGSDWCLALLVSFFWFRDTLIPTQTIVPMNNDAHIENHTNLLAILHEYSISQM